MTASLAASDRLAWYCLRTQPKRETVAEAHLRREARLEVLMPRIRFPRLVRGRKTSVLEPLFPGYVFARFSLAQLRHALSLPGVTGIVEFGGSYPELDEMSIGELRNRMNAQDTLEGEEAWEPGIPVTICEGPLAGLKATIERYFPQQRRIALLLEFLGSCQRLEMDCDRLIGPRPQPSS